LRGWRLLENQDTMLELVTAKTILSGNEIDLYLLRAKLEF
jgi:hypothetical protein